jgi:epoxyqueuosine reductase QueG
MEKFKEKIRCFLLKLDVDLIGFADVSDLYEKFKIAVVFGIAKSKISLLAEEKSTTFLAFASSFIDNITFQLKTFLEDEGYQVFTKYLQDETAQNKFKYNDPKFLKRYTFRFPLVEFAVRAGLGIKGRMGFLVTPEFGSRIRIMSVLTDALLPPDSHIHFYPCRNCRECLDICPLQDSNNEKRQWDYCVGCHLCIDKCPSAHP